MGVLGEDQQITEQKKNRGGWTEKGFGRGGGVVVGGLMKRGITLTTTKRGFLN